MSDRADELAKTIRTTLDEARIFNVDPIGTAARWRNAYDALDEMLGILKQDAQETQSPCPGYPSCRCIGKSQWSSPDDLHGTFGAPGMMGG